MTISKQPSHPSSPLEYKHLKLVDSFYSTDDPENRDKTRVTRDEKSGHVIECVRKMRLGDLNVYSPKRAADWRISVNIEVPGMCHLIIISIAENRKVHNHALVPHPVGTPTHTRRKDRICYSHEEFNIDLTQVTSNTGPNAAVRLCTLLARSPFTNFMLYNFH